MSVRSAYLNIRPCRWYRQFLDGGFGAGIFDKSAGWQNIGEAFTNNLPSYTRITVVDVLEVVSSALSIFAVVETLAFEPACSMEFLELFPVRIYRTD